jgi:thiol-disulfide isomerase/thioredoxin
MRLTIFILFFACITSYSQRNIGVLKIIDLEKRIHSDSDTTYIINFWATWCMPCIKELPAFDSIHNDFKNQKVKVLLVSLDFTEYIEKMVTPFIEKKKIQSEVVVLDEVNGNYFIPKVSNEWTGAIPATLIVNNKKQKRYFFEKKLDYAFLKNQIELIEQTK